MTAPVVGFTADVPNGWHGESFIEIEPDVDGFDQIDIRISGRPNNGADYRAMLVSHDEARQIIAGLASVIT